jgi:hypothetical protein
MDEIPGCFDVRNLLLLPTLEKRFSGEVKAISDEFQCKHPEKVSNNNLINGTSRESGRRLSLTDNLNLQPNTYTLKLPHNFDLKLKEITDIIEVKNPSKPFSLEQNSFIVQFLTALEQPLKEIKQSLTDDEHQNIAFSRIEEKIRERLKEELKTVRNSHSVFNTYKSSLGIADGMEKNLRLEEDFKTIFSKLLSFGFEDLATRVAFKKIEENGFNDESVEILKGLKSHINDFHEQKQGKRADTRIFNNPFADLNYQSFLEDTFHRDIKASNFLKPQSLENLDNYLNFSQKLLKSKPTEISPNELFEVKLKHKILQNLDEISYKADLDISNFKKLINIIDENRKLSLTELPSIEEYTEDKLKNIFSKRDGEDKLNKLNLEGTQFATLIRESTSTELKNEAKAFLLRSLKSVQSMPNFIGIVSTLAHLNIRLHDEHRQQINEFISEKIKDFNELKGSKDSSRKESYENFILGMREIYDQNFELEKLNGSHLNNHTTTVPEKRNSCIFEEFKEKDLLKKLTLPDKGLDTINSAIEEIKEYFKECSSAEDFQGNITKLNAFLNGNMLKLTKTLRQECIAAAFNGYMENRQGDEEIKSLEMQKNSALNSIY